MMSMPVSVFYKVCLGNFVYLRGGGAGGAEGALAPPPTLRSGGGGLSPTTFSEASGGKNMGRFSERQTLDSRLRTVIQWQS